MTVDFKKPHAGPVYATHEQPLFSPGDAVRILERKPIGHYRVPIYLRGKRGVVEQVIEPAAIDNEEEGFGRNAGSRRHYYRIALPMTQIWPDYDGSVNDGLRIEVFETWLERERTMSDHHHDPAHPPATDTGTGYYDIMETAVRELLIAKGLFSAEEIRQQIEVLDSRSPALGARVVARAWTDPQFRQRLLADGRKACEDDFGITFYDDTSLIVLENTPTVHNLIVCTLCSCYPRPVLGLPPDWYKLKPYRSRAVSNPRAVLAQFGTHLPDSVAVRVHDSTAMVRYMVLPLRPDGTDAYSEAQLETLVTRDTLIGVTPARLPGSTP